MRESPNVPYSAAFVKYFYWTGALEQSIFLGNLRNAIWLFGVSSWLFGITDRSIALLSDGYLSALDLIQLSIAAFFFVSWLLLKPSKLENIDKFRKRRGKAAIQSNYESFRRNDYSFYSENVENGGY